MSANEGQKSTDYLYSLLFDDTDRSNESYSRFRLKMSQDRRKANEDPSWFNTFKKPSETLDIAAPPIKWGAVFKRSGRRFVALPIQEPSYDEQQRFLQAGISYFPIDSCGKFFGAVTGLRLQLREGVTSLELEQNIRAQHEDPNYQGHDWEDIYPLLQDFCIFEIDQQRSRFAKRSDFAIYYIISQYDKFRVFSDDVQTIVDDLLLHSAEYPRENILVSLTTAHNNHAFLEVYRCIEFLLQLPYALALKNELQSSHSALDIASASREHLSWRRKEKPALIKLFKLVDVNLISQLGFENTPLFRSLSLTLTPTGWSRTGHAKVAERIYKLRNHLVHQIDRGQFSKATDSDWESLLHLLLVCLRFWLSHFKDEL